MPLQRKDKAPAGKAYISFILFYLKIIYNFDMIRELQALAKMADDNERKPSERVNKLVAGISQGFRGMGPAERAGMAMLPLAPVVRHLVNSTKGFPAETVPKNKKQLQDFVSKLVSEQKGVADNLRIELASRPGQAEYWRSYPWNKIQRQVVRLAPKSNPLTIAHELGHAVQPNKFEKYLNIGSGLARTPLVTALPSILALSGGLSKDEEAPIHAKAAPFMGGALLASILGEETRANIRALRLLKQNGIPTTLLQKLRQFVPSASYLGRGALLVGAPMGILKGMKLYEKSRKTKHPFTLSQMAGMTPQRLSETPTPEDIKKKWAGRL